jgi:hypothetical protein
MLRRSPFEEPFLRATCYNLLLPVEPSDLKALSVIETEGPLFASTKIDASDERTVRMVSQFGFRKICAQTLLRVHTEGASGSADGVHISDRLDLNPRDIRAHALQIDTGRFRQDHLIATEAAINIYAAWVRNSTQGAKHIASLGRNFASFADSAGVRWIDLVSVLDKKARIAVKLLNAIIVDAWDKNVEQVKVLTDSNNLPALHAYGAAGFQSERSLVVFHLLRCR